MSSKFLRSATALFVVGAVAAAQGDDCTTATPLFGAGSGVVQTTSINTSGFTIAGPAAFCNGLFEPTDGFYTFTASVTGNATFSTCGASTLAPGGNAGGVDTYISIYPGTCPLGFDFACNNDAPGCFAGESEVTFTVTAGTTYYVQVGDWSGSNFPTIGTLAYVENLVVTPPNDTPAGATFVVGPTATVADDNTGSLVDGPLGTCGLMGKDLWYYYVPTQTGVVIITTCNANGGLTGNINGIGDSVLAAWNDAGGFPGAQINCNDDSCSTTGLASTIAVAITSGVGIYVSAGGFNSSFGTYVIDFQELGGPAQTGDDCTVADVSAVGPGVYPYSSSGFFIPGPTPGCATNSDMNDYWYLYTATQSGLAVVSNCSASTLAPGGSAAGNTDTVIAAWDATACPPTTQLGCNDFVNGCNAGESELVFSVTAGTTYYLQVRGWNANGSISGAVAIQEYGGPPATGDDCSVADSSAVGPGVYPYSSAGFLIPGPTPNCAINSDGNDYWYQYTATQSGLAVVSNCPSSILAPGGSAAGNTDTVIAAWDATACPPTTQLGCNDFVNGCNGGESELVFSVTAGTTYYLQVRGWNANGAISGAVAIAEVAPPVNDDCLGALPITPGVPVIASNGTATTSSPTGSCGMSGELWYSLVVPCTGGTLVLDTCGSAIDTTLSVWDNCGGVELGCNDQASAGPCAFSNQSYLEVTGLTAGQVVYIAVGGWNNQTGNITLNVRCDYTHVWTTPAGPGSVQLENVDGPANALAFSAITLDLVHPGLPGNQTFPNGWFFGIPMGFPELFQQITWPGGLPFTGILNSNGYLFNFALPAGTTSGLAGIATVWSVGVAFDPLTGFATVADTTAPTAFPL